MLCINILSDLCLFLFDYFLAMSFLKDATSTKLAWHGSGFHANAFKQVFGYDLRGSGHYFHFERDGSQKVAQRAAELWTDAIVRFGRPP